MKPPYHTRLLIALGGHEPMELCRYRRPLAEIERQFWLRDLSPEWQVIEEHTCRTTLTPRVEPSDPCVPRRVRTSLSAIERGEIVYAS